MVIQLPHMCLNPIAYRELNQGNGYSSFLMKPKLVMDRGLLSGGRQWVYITKTKAQAREHLFTLNDLRSVSLGDASSVRPGRKEATHYCIQQVAATAGSFIKSPNPFARAVRRLLRNAGDRHALFGIIPGLLQCSLQHETNAIRGCRQRCAGATSGRLSGGVQVATPRIRGSH